MKQLVLLLISLLLGAITLSAQDPAPAGDEDSGIPILKWMGPGKPGTFAEYNTGRSKLPLEIKAVKTAPQAVKGPTPPAGGEKVIILVNSGLYSAVETRINTYVADLEARSYTVEVYQSSYGNAEDLKAFIIANQADLISCVFVGDIPCAWFEDEDDYDLYGHKEWPCDLFLCDLDGQWEDKSMSSGIYDTHTDGTGDQAPEIYIGRIDASRMTHDTEANLTNAYFDKLHTYYTGTLTGNNQGLTYTDDDWQSYSDQTTSIQYAYPSYDSFADSSVEMTDYRDNRLGSAAGTYEFIQLSCHSASTYHAFERGGNLNSSTIIGIPPSALFYNLFCCSGLRFTSNNCLGNAYIFNTSSQSLAAVGSTKTGSMLTFNQYYNRLKEWRTFGDAFKEWFIYKAPYTTNDVWWFYGMTIVGDPMAVPCQQPPGPIIEFDTEEAHVDEDCGTALIPITISETQAGTVSIDYTVTAVTASAGSDFTLASGTAVIPAGSTGADLSAAIIDNALNEGSEYLDIELTAVSTGTLGWQSTHRLYIDDDDPLPTATLTTMADTVQEDGGPITLTVELSTASGRDVYVGFSTNGTASWGTDYTMANFGSISIPAGSTSGTETITLTDDTDLEPDETILLTMNTSSSYAIGMISMYTLTIIDNDPGGTPAVTLPFSSTAILESVGTYNLSLSIPAAVGVDVEIPFSISGGGATNPDDFTISASPAIISAGTTSTDITITVVDDALEENEGINLLLGTIVNGVAGSYNSCWIQLIDNDAGKPICTFSAAQQNVDEGCGTVTVTCELDTTAAGDITVPIFLSGTATEETDYTVPAEEITITAGNLTGSVAFSIIDDTTEESPETIVINMGTSTDAAKGPVSDHTITITNNDVPAAAFTAGAHNCNEATAGCTVTVELDRTTFYDVNIPFTLSGTAADSTDYTITASPVTIPARSLTADLTITMIDDSLVESDESIVITMGTPVNASAGTIIVHTVTLTDDETANVTVTLAGQTRDEGIGSCTITLALSDTLEADVTIPFTVSGTAAAGSDYAITASPVIITAGNTSTTITVTVTDDSVEETTETAVITLGTPTNAGLGILYEHTLTITDNDGTQAGSSKESGCMPGSGQSAGIVLLLLTAMTGLSFFRSWPSR